MTLEAQVIELRKSIEAGNIGTAAPWGGAGVVLCDKLPTEKSDDWRPAPRYVVTPFVAEVSWFFEQTHQMFREHEDYFAWKEELYGRIADAVSIDSASLNDVLSRALDQASAMAQKVDNYGGPSSR